MKKVIGLLLILALAAALLAGCGGGSSTSRKELMKGQWKSSYGWSYDLREDQVILLNGTSWFNSPDVYIMNADMTQMLTTRVIDGREYLLIPVVDEIEVNGIRILQTAQKEDRTESQ